VSDRQDPSLDPSVDAERPGWVGYLRRLAIDLRPLRESRDFRRLWLGTGISARQPDHSNAMLFGMPSALFPAFAEDLGGGPQTLGNVEAGVVASLTSVRFSIVSGGVACVVGTVAIALALPALARYDARRPHA
jgi:hypothetical protein